MSYLQLFVVFLFVQEMDQAGQIVEAQGDRLDTRFLHGGHNELQRSLVGALHLLLETGIRRLAGRDPVAREQLRQAIPVDQTLVPGHIKMLTPGSIISVIPGYVANMRLVFAFSGKLAISHWNVR
ncbi:condensin complex subunit 1 [Apiospora arundinis]